MEESVLRNYFLEKVSVEALRVSLAGSLEKGVSVNRFHVIDMEGEFEVEPVHLVRLCDAFLEGSLLPEHLQFIGFCLIASEGFYWNVSVVSDVVNDWSVPEINYPINSENVAKWKSGLLRGE